MVMMSSWSVEILCTMIEAFWGDWEDLSRCDLIKLGFVKRERHGLQTVRKRIRVLMGRRVRISAIMSVGRLQFAMYR